MDEQRTGDTSEDEDNELNRLGFTQERELGEGSYSQVKSAVWKRNGDADTVRVALKVINRATAPVEFKKKFLPRELKILFKLKHPNIIQMYDSFVVKNKTYICLEFAGHGDLLDFIQLRGPLDQEETRKLFKDICNGISYLHDKGVVHRDLKCENILLARNNEIKIADFGFAREVEQDQLSRTFCGSAAYAAPEVIMGVAYEAKMSDLWSLGVILFIMPCCVMPFRDHSRSALLNDQKLPLRFPSNVAHRLPNSYRNLTSRILNHVQEERFRLDDILKHPWMNPTVENLSSEATSAIMKKTMREASVDSGFGSTASSYSGRSTASGASVLSRNK